MADPVELPDGEMFMVSDRLMLVQSMESILANGFFLGRAGAELAVHITFQGRINKSTEQSDVTVALSPVDAYELVNMILTGLELLPLTHREILPKDNDHD